MEYYLILLLLITGFIVIYFKKPVKHDKSSSELLLRLNENLRKEIQEVRREMSENSEKGRKEIENKLSTINKGINTFQNSSKEDIRKQFVRLFEIEKI